MPQPPNKIDIATVWARTDRTGSCWIYLGRKEHHGHGVIGMMGRRWKVHRLVWTLLYGPIPDGAVVRHLCDNPPCVRPDHLAVGTQADNVADAVARGRVSRGERVPNSKLSPEAVAAIRRDYVPRVVTARALGQRYGVSEFTIRSVLSKGNWKWV